MKKVAIVTGATAAALVNSLLKIKPIFTLNQSDAHTIALPRTIPSAMKRMLKIMA